IAGGVLLIWQPAWLNELPQLISEKIDELLGSTERSDDPLSNIRLDHMHEPGDAAGDVRLDYHDDPQDTVAIEQPIISEPEPGLNFRLLSRLEKGQAFTGRLGLVRQMEPWLFIR